LPLNRLKKLNIMQKLEFVETQRIGCARSETGDTHYLAGMPCFQKEA